MPCVCESCARHARTLGLEQTPRSRAPLRKAFRAAAKLWHPDRFERDPVLRLEAEERFKQIQVAYRELTEHYEDPVQWLIEPAFSAPRGTEPFSAAAYRAGADPLEPQNAPAPRPSPSSAHPATSWLPIFRQSPSASSSRTCAIPSAPSPSSTSPVQHRRRDRLRSSYSLPTKEFSSATPATSSLCSGIPIWARSGSSRTAAAAFPASGKASLSASPPLSRDTS